MPMPKLPAEPIDGYQIIFYYATGYPDVTSIVRRCWTYSASCGHWERSEGSFSPGWALPDYKAQGYYDTWADCFPTEREAQLHIEQCLWSRLDSAWKEYAETRKTLDAWRLKIHG